MGEVINFAPRAKVLAKPVQSHSDYSIAARDHQPNWLVTEDGDIIYMSPPLRLEPPCDTEPSGAA